MDPTTTVVIAIVLVLLLIAAKLSIRIVRQYEKGVLFRLGRVVGVREPGLQLIIPVVDRLPLVSLRIVTMPIQSQGIITQDNVSVDVSAVAYYRVVDAVKSVVAIENVASAIDQIAQTTLRKVVGRHTLDQTLSETERINVDIREILDVLTIDWVVEVTTVTPSSAASFTAAWTSAAVVGSTTAGPGFPLGAAVLAVAASWL